MNSELSAEKKLSVADAVVVVVGVVVSSGIFKTPSLIAANSGNEWIVALIWLAGGVISLIGALCYAELASAYPHEGGDYFYFIRAFGKPAGFLFAWARMTVIQTGSITVLAFLVGDYASQVVNLGAFSSAYYAGLIIIMLTLVNITGIRQGMRIQKTLITGIILGLLIVGALGIILVSAPPPTRGPSLPTSAGIGLAMIFVLFTYGGWNEAVYLSAEVHDTRRSMVRVLLYSIGIITAIYLLINLVFIKSLGLEAMAESEVVAADLMRRVMGENGARLISLLISVTVLSTINGLIITGARTNYALGRDFPLFGFLGNWRETAGTPVNALILQGAIACVLVVIGAAARGGFETMVEYTAPVFWFFFLLAGISLFVLRRKEPDTPRPFRVPFYPLTPILFCLVCAYLLQSSVAYTGFGALLGIGVVLVGVPLLWLKNKSFGQRP